MEQRVNKNAICTVLFLDIVGYSEQLVAEQFVLKERFNQVISDAVRSVAENDRIMLDTGDGAAIAFLGAPEECLFIAMAIRDEILQQTSDRETPLAVRIGINLGPVRVLHDINGQLNIIGDGINTAQRVMSFADPNQILVSRSYYEVVSRLTGEITALFSYAGVRMDKYVREHEVYEVVSPDHESHAAGLVAEQSSMMKAVLPFRVSRTLMWAGGTVGVGLLLFSLFFYLSIKDDPAVPPEEVGQIVDAPVPEKKAAADEHQTTWQKVLGTFKQSAGDKQPTCTDAQRMLKQCD